MKKMDNKMEYPLTYSSWGNEEIDAMQEVIKSGLFTMGQKTLQYESMFAKYFNSKYAVMVNSGSSANLIAIAALVYSGKIKKGAEVLVPAVSWSTTYYPLYQYGLKLRFIDIDRETLNYDSDALRNGITVNTKMIMCVNLLGNPNDFSQIEHIANEYGLLLIEDNCEAMGARYHNRFTGTFGLIGTFSTFFSHHISTMEGGIVITDDEELYNIMLSLRAHGWTRNLPNESLIYKKENNEFYESFNFIFPGYNVRPLEIEAAVGIEQLKKLNNFVSTRRKNAENFLQLMENFNEFVQTQKEIGESSWFGFSVLLRGKMEKKRDELVKYLINNKIEVRPIVAGNFCRNKVIEYFDYSISKELENSNYLHHNGFFIGNNHSPMEQEIEYFGTVFDKYIKEN